MKACVNCGTTNLKKGYNGRCRLCAHYLWSKGCERPERLYNRSRNCIICEAKVHANNRCNTCYVYHLKNGADRPEHLIRKKSVRCKNSNCGIPLSLVKRNRAGPYCGACYSYQNRTGSNRPREYCQAPGSIGWCMCGQPASRINKEIKEKKDNGEIVFIDNPLCNQCYEVKVK